MVHFPVRKCYQAAKLGLLVVLVVFILALFEHWQGGKKNTKAEYTDPVEAEYERQILEDEARIIPGLGEGGAAAHLIGEEKKLGEESEKKLAINVYLSDRIPYNRTLKDFRNPACKRVVYDAVLPSASVILIFHNEPYSVVVRTIWSVVNSARRSQPWYQHANFGDGQKYAGYPGQDPNSEFVYLKEIILVDDNSTLPELKGKLSHYVRTRLPPDLIRILRLPDRTGVIRARLEGAKVATGEVLVFLDAHTEAVADWLRPLVQRVHDKRDAVVHPAIDVISQYNFHFALSFESDEGLMLARMKGARLARGDVLIFLDAHCEAGADWMRPLLQRVKHKRDAVLTPIIDVVDQSTFKFEAPESYQVGGFSFMGHFTWTDVPEREKKRRGSEIAPTWSPTMAGGLFAINRAYFWELGAYDEQMGGWGGENLEMSFRIWQCGGTLETIPCSRVGHVFRSFHPYGMPAHMDTHGINTARMAEVWMDEYAELFYLHRPDLRNNPAIGHVTHRKILREKLKCKSFQWYLDNIYKEKFVPVRDVYGYGRFKNEYTHMCLDTLQREEDGARLGVYPCHEELQATQYFSFSLAGEVRDEVNCASVQLARMPADDNTTDKAVVMTPCRGTGREQKWRRLTTGQLQHATSRLCLRAPAEPGDVRAARCSPQDKAQLWAIDYTEDNNFHANDLQFGVEREQRLNRLRGQRRISRSLLSFAEVTEAPLDARRHYENVTERRRPHKRTHHKRHGHKRTHGGKKKTKNKFILKLLRTLNNGSTQHLEVDIHCRHTQLLPNNSFVRDLVTVLVDNNVKVINNGRLFERNKVTSLDSASPAVLHMLDLPSSSDDDRARPSEHEHDRARPSEHEHDRARPSEHEHDRARPSEHEHDRARPSEHEHDRARPSEHEHDRARPSEHEHDRARPSEHEHDRVRSSDTEHSRATGKLGAREGDRTTHGPRKRTKKQKVDVSEQVISNDVPQSESLGGLGRIELDTANRGHMGHDREHVDHDKAHVGHDGETVDHGKAHVGRDGPHVGHDGSRVGHDGSHVGHDGSHVGHDGSHVGHDGSHVGHDGSHTGRATKKIIIEDFVEVQGSSATPMPPVEKKHVRKHKSRNRSRPALSPASSEYVRDDLQRKLEQKLGDDAGSAPRDSLEATNDLKQHSHADDTDNKHRGHSDERREPRSRENVVPDSMDRSSGREDWEIGESRFRRKSHIRPLRLKPNDLAAHSSEKTQQASKHASSDINSSEKRQGASEHEGDKNTDSSEKTIASQGQRMNQDVVRPSDSVASQGQRASERASKRASERRHERKRKDDEYTTEEPKSSGEAGPPVKVVMKSNLTFNLGDEFFAWKNKATKDLVVLKETIRRGLCDVLPGHQVCSDVTERTDTGTDILGSLSVPAQNSTAAPARARAPDDSDSSDSSDDSSGE